MCNPSAIFQNLRHSIPLALITLLLALTTACATSPSIPQPTAITRFKQLKFSDLRATAKLVHDLYGVTAVYDTRTATIFIRGPQDAVNQSIAVMADLDGAIDDGSQEPNVFLYFLQNAKAADLAPILNTMAHQDYFFDPYHPEERSPFAIPDPRTNTLIIQTDIAYTSKIKALIEKLDRSTIPTEEN